jgi:uncharacterized membrane protein YkoI
MQLPHFTRLCARRAPLRAWAIGLCAAVLAVAAASAQADDRGRARRMAVESWPSYGEVQHSGRHRGQSRDDQGSDDDSRDIRVADSGMSLDQAVSMVEKRYKARVVRTEVRTEGDRKIYVLRLLNDAGRVWTVRVDASSGSVS